MRLVYLATGVFDKGGISRYSRYQISALRDQLGEDRVQVLSFLGPGRDDFEEPFPVDYRGKDSTWIGKARFSRAAARFCLSRTPTVIWCNHLHLLPLGLMTRLLAPRARIAVNVYGHELWSHRQWLHQQTLPKADRIVSDCHFSADYARRRYCVSPERLRVAWDCVDTGRFRPKPRSEELLRSFGIPVGSRYRYILTLGRIDSKARYKGYDQLLNVMAALKAEAHLLAVFAGEGNDRPRLERRVDQEGLRGKVFFTGSIHEDLLVEVYNLCDLFILVSESGRGRGEGIPLTPLEAAACGKPIIVGNEDGSREAVMDGINGRIVSPRDPNEIREALLGILSDDERRKAMGLAARNRIETEFSYNSFRSKHAQILAELN